MPDLIVRLDESGYKRLRALAKKAGFAPEDYLLECAIGGRGNIHMNVNSEQMDFLRVLARRNNTDIPNVLLMAAMGRGRKMSGPVENLFNEFILVAGILRSLYARMKDSVDDGMRADMGKALDRIYELSDMAWELMDSAVADSLSCENETRASKKILIQGKLL